MMRFVPILGEIFNVIFGKAVFYNQPKNQVAEIKILLKALKPDGDCY